MTALPYSRDEKNHRIVESARHEFLCSPIAGRKIDDRIVESVPDDFLCSAIAGTNIERTATYSSPRPRKCYIQPLQAQEVLQTAPPSPGSATYSSSKRKIIIYRTPDGASTLPLVVLPPQPAEPSLSIVGNPPFKVQASYEGCGPKGPGVLSLTNQSP